MRPKEKRVHRKARKDRNRKQTIVAPYIFDDTSVKWQCLIKLALGEDVYAVG